MGWLVNSVDTSWERSAAQYTGRELSRLADHLGGRRTWLQSNQDSAVI